MTPLAQHHCEMLAASGIDEERARRRGYETVNDKGRLIDVKVAVAGRRVPGLLVPMRGVDGDVWGYQYRPDYPRADAKRGKDVKYETPVGQRNGIDVPPGVGPMLADPAVPLWITEGVKKADSAAAHGFCCIALPGVWSWRGKNEHGGKTAIADWNDVALNDRPVVLAFDGDVARKDSVRLALSGLAAYLKLKGARVRYLHLPDTADKTGLDDWLMDHGVEHINTMIKPDPPPKAAPDLADIADIAHIAHIADSGGTRERPSTPVDGAELLDELEAFLGRFVAYPSDNARVAHVLWIVHCWFMDAWESTPRIAFLSPEPGSGKSRALEVMEPLVPRPVHAVNTTPAYLFRKVSDEAGRPTILYDEIDTVFGPRAKDNEDIRGMLNAGHRKGATAGRCVMRGKIVETEELPAYCAVALAGLDDLPDTIMTRAVVVRMRRRAPDEHIEPWRMRVNGGEAEKLRNWLAAWAESVAEQLTGDFWPDMPPEVTDRDADVWEALLAVADLAGGDWPRRARVAAVALVAASKQRAPSVGVLLLRDIKAAFDNAHVDQLSTEQLLLALNRMDESPWSTIRRGEPLDGRGLSQRLSKYGIGSKQHAGDRGVRGYSRTQFEDAWNRYLAAPTPPDVSATSATSAPAGPATSATSATESAPETVTGPHVADVADKSGPTRDGLPPGAPTDRTPGMTDRVQQALANANRFTPPTGPGRCGECHFHIATQGHRDDCQQTRRSA